MFACITQCFFVSLVSVAHSMPVAHSMSSRAQRGDQRFSWFKKQGSSGSSHSSAGSPVFASPRSVQRDRSDDTLATPLTEFASSRAPVDCNRALEELLIAHRAISDLGYDAGVFKRSTPEVLRSLIGHCMSAYDLVQREAQVLSGSQHSDDHGVSTSATGSSFCWHTDREAQKTLKELVADIEMLRKKVIVSAGGTSPLRAKSHHVGGHSIRPSMSESFANKYGAMQGSRDLTPHLRVVLKLCDLFDSCDCNDRYCAQLRDDIATLQSCFLQPEEIDSASAHAAPVARELSFDDFVATESPRDAVLALEDDVHSVSTADDVLSSSSSDPVGAAAGDVLSSSSRAHRGDPELISQERGLMDSVSGVPDTSSRAERGGMRAWLAARSPLQRWSMITAGAVAGIGVCVAIVYAVKKWRKQKSADEEGGEVDVVEDESHEERE